MSYKKYLRSRKALIIFLLSLMIIVPNIFYFIILHEKRIKIDLINNLVLISLGILLMKQKITKIIGYLLILAFVVNNALEMFSVYFYKGEFNLAMALSFLSTNTREATEMSLSYWFVFLFAIIYFIGICYLANSFKEYISRKMLIFSFLIFSIIPVYNIYVEAQNSKMNALYIKSGESSASYYLRHTSLDAFGPLLDAHHYLQIVQKTSEETFHYPPFKVVDNGIQNIIVVLGESARRDALSLYGNPVSTTPLIEKRLSNLLIYNNAVAPADFTSLVVPLILSKQLPGSDFSIERNKDNVIALANSSNIWKTYWVSNQEKVAFYVNLFANIDLKARFKYWTNPGLYDEAVLPVVNNILKDSSGKRLVFVHLEGSHPVAGRRYPKTFDKIHANRDEFKNEYDNSIAYTDFIVDQIIKSVEGSKSILIYLSDHGQSIVDGAYRHSFTKKGIEVPFFIWHSDLVDAKFKKSGRIDETISTTILYNMLVDLLGVDGLTTKGINDSVKVMDGSMKIYNYSELDPGL